MKIPALKFGDTIALAAPAGATTARSVSNAERDLQALGFKTLRGRYLLENYGYLGANDEHRASDINELFLNDEVKAIFFTKGGWGCGRMLHLLDYPLIEARPKIVMGFSDITALLLALYARSGLPTFHGPMASSRWHDFHKTELQMHLQSGQPLPLSAYNAETLINGTIQGTLVGGNLMVITSLLGTPFLPDFQDKILFLEETHETTSRIDRLMAHLENAGVLKQIKGLIFGGCTQCTGTISLERVLRRYVEPNNLPSIMGFPFGHISTQNIIPIGVQAELNTERKTLTFLTSAIQF